MENTVGFSVRDNNNFYKIDISKTLLHFIEFDFTYFWEQCIEAGRVARKTGRLPQNSVSAARAVVAKAHPYIEACISTDYSEIVTDCIIEYICHSERIGLEELWARCISPKNMYESAIFRRISEYKTSRAMNRWTSIVRLQEYAQNKVEFIFGPENGQTSLRDDLIRARKEYFDLAVSVAANELGCPPAALPSIRLCNPATVPNAAFAVGKVSKSIYRRFSETLANGRDMSLLEGKNCSRIQDQIAMEAYAYVKNMTRPGELDMRYALEAIEANPAELYLPDSLKAAVDLEMDLMCTRKIYLRKCDSCGRYFTVTDDNPRCDRVNSSGKTCRRQYEELCESIAEQALATAEEEKRVAAEASESIQEAFDAVVAQEAVSAEPPEPVSYTVPKEMEKRGQKLYNALYKRVGRGIDENEFREWSQYLSNMKRNIKIGEATVKQFEDFLDYSDKLCQEVKLAAKNKTVHAPVEKPYDYANADSPKRRSSGKGSKKESRQEDAQENELPEQLTISETVVIPSSENVEVKPFVPQTFDSLFDAFMAGYAEDADNSKEASPDKSKKPVEIKAPQWERLTREDAYGKDKKD